MVWRGAGTAEWQGVVQMLTFSWGQGDYQQPTLQAGPVEKDKQQNHPKLQGGKT